MKSRVKGLQRVINTADKAINILEAVNKRLEGWNLAPLEVPNAIELRKLAASSWKAPKKAVFRKASIQVGDEVVLTPAAAEHFSGALNMYLQGVHLKVQDILRKGTHPAAPYVYILSTQDGKILASKSDIAPR